MGNSTIQTPSGAADCKDDSTDIPTETAKWSEYPPQGPTGASDNWGEGSSKIYAGTSDNWGEGQTDSVSVLTINQLMLLFAGREVGQWKRVVVV